ncbi:MAG: hypothetical protein AAFP00_00275 [Bacteroidota bacterium]
MKTLLKIANKYRKYALHTLVDIGEMYIFAIQMKKPRFTYYLLLVPLLPVVLVSFKKIDKISFFNHYFKVIEEVELRNSQELTDEGLAVWYIPSTIQSTSIPAFPTIYLWLWAAILGTVIGILSVRIKHILSPHLLLHPAVACRNLYPIRAP